MLRGRLPITCVLLLIASPARPQDFGERLKGRSIDARVTMPTYGNSSRGPGASTLLRTIRIYISSKGRIFDYSQGGSIHGDGREVLSGGYKIVEYGEQWMQGAIGQEWDLAPHGLIRRRIYPWGQQVYTISVAANMASCSIRGTIHSSRPDKKFFLYDEQDGQPDELLSHGRETGVCHIENRNVFE